MASVEMKFSKESFARLGLPDLLLNLWDYADPRHKDCKICLQYAKWQVELLSELWLDDEDLDFGFVINSVVDGSKNFCDFGKIVSHFNIRSVSTPHHFPCICHFCKKNREREFQQKSLVVLLEEVFVYYN